MKLDDAPDPEDRDKGWKPDPLEDGKEREWDGEEWTGNTQGTGSHPNRKKQLVAGAIVGIAVVGILGFVLGSGSRQTEVDDANAQIEALEAENSDALGELREYDENWDELVAEVDAEKAKWEKKRQKVKDNTAEVEAIKRDLAEQQVSLDAREKRISSAEAEIKNNRFGDGVWHVGVDFDSGIYRSTTADCYWEKLTEPGGGFDALIENGLGANQTVTIDSEWFSSAGCGKWTKIG